jgi:hypothetical protein
MSDTTISNLDTNEFDTIKFMYDKVYDELNRCRDWPIKIMTFTSAFFFLIIGFSNLRTENIEIIRIHSVHIILLITVVLILTITIIVIQHYRYIDYRNIQIKLQIKMEIKRLKADDKEIFPKDWFKQKDKSIFTGFQGWFYYAFYVFSFWLLTVFIIASL